MEDENQEISPEKSSRLKYELRQRHLLAWIEKNSKPKVLVLPKFIRKLTRFQKRGPMSNADWLRWKKWVKRFGAPKGKYPALFSDLRKKRHSKDTKKINQGAGDFIKELDKERMLFLAKPKLIRMQKKYKTPPEELLTFVPKINSPNLKKSKPRKPKLRVGVSLGALKYKLTNHTKNLAKPKQQQPNLSLLLAENKKFSPQEWIQYRRYLTILSFPKIYLPPEISMIDQKCTCGVDSNQGSKEKKSLKKKKSIEKTKNQIKETVENAEI